MVPKTDTILQFAARFSFIIITFWTMVAIVSPVIGWDPIAYHLPFSSYIWNIGGSYHTYHIGSEGADNFYSTWLGYPVMGEFLQGFFWKITGSLHGVILPNIIFVLVFVFVVGKLMKIPRPLLILGLFGNPVCAHLYLESYIDLIDALSLAIGFFLLMRYQYLLAKGRWCSKCLWGGALCLAFAALCKYPLLVYSYMVLIIVYGTFLITVRLKTSGQWLGLMYGLLIGVAISCVAIMNIITYHNPFYPIETRIAGQIIFPGPFDSLNFSPVPDYPLAILKFIPIDFFLSASELDWSIRGVREVYSLEGATGLDPLNGGGVRTGTWGGMLFVFLFIWISLAWSAYARRFFSKKPLSFSGTVTLAGVGLLVCLIFLPGSQILRYSLAIYLIMLPIALKALVVSRKSTSISLIVFISIALYYHSAFIFSQTITQRSLFVDYLTPSADIMKVDISAFSPNRFFYTPYPLAFRFSQAMTGRPIRISQNPVDRDITCPIGVKIDNFILQQYLIDGWYIFAGDVGLPTNRRVTLQLLPTPRPNGPLFLELHFKGNATPSGEIWINHRHLATLIPTNPVLLPIPVDLVQSGATLEIEITDIPIATPPPFELVSLTLRSGSLPK